LSFTEKFSRPKTTKSSRRSRLRTASSFTSATKKGAESFIEEGKTEVIVAPEGFYKKAFQNGHGEKEIFLANK